MARIGTAVICTVLAMVGQARAEVCFGQPASADCYVVSGFVRAIAGLGVPAELTKQGNSFSVTEDGRPRALLIYLLEAAASPDDLSEFVQDNRTELDLLAGDGMREAICGAKSGNAGTVHNGEYDFVRAGGVLSYEVRLRRTNDKGSILFDGVVASGSISTC
jgi:hypothetical protein